jgi:hypothetical protein
MRSLLRPWPRTSSLRRLHGQALRPCLCLLLMLSLALPARAAPVAPVESASPAPSPEGSLGSSVAAPSLTGGTPVISTTAEAPLYERQAEARRVFRLGKEQFNAGDYAAAAVSFEASYAAAESAEAAYNAALAHDKAGRDLMTMGWFRKYLAFDASTTDKGYPHALRRVEELRARLGELRLQIDSRESVRAVLVNAEPVLITDFPRLVAPGRIDVRLFGDRADQVADIPVEVAAGGTWTIHFTGFARAVSEPVLRPDPAPIVRADPPPDPVQGRRRVLSIATWSGVGVTVASAITMGVFGGLALRKSEAWNMYLCDDGNVCPDQYREAMAAADALHRYRNAANVMVGVTAGLAVITLALGIAALRTRQKVQGEGKGRVRVTFTGLQWVF